MKTRILSVLALAISLFSTQVFSQSVISGCVNKAAVESSRNNAGGIAGFVINTEIANCYNRGSVEASKNAGGLIGFAYNPEDIFTVNASGNITALKIGVNVPEIVVIPSKIGAITVKKFQPSDTPFRNNTTITKLIIEEGVEELPITSSFHACTNLKEVYLPSTLKYIGTNCFNSCSNVTGDLVLPVNLATWGASAFRYCSSLEKVYISSSKVAVPNNCFNNCSNLKEVYVTSDIVIGCGTTDPFSNCHPDLKIYVQSSLVDTYKTTIGWINYADRIYAIP